MGQGDGQARSYDDVEIVLGTLAAGAVLKGALKIDGGREQGVRIQKLMAAVSVIGQTTGEGPLIIGLTNADLSVSEVAEALAADPQKPDDVPGSEQSMRQIMPIWFVPKNQPSNNEIQRLVEIPYPWKLVAEGDGLAWFVANLDGSALTTGALVDIFSTTIGEWNGD